LVDASVLGIDAVELLRALLALPQRQGVLGLLGLDVAVDGLPHQQRGPVHPVCAGADCAEGQADRPEHLLAGGARGPVAARVDLRVDALELVAERLPLGAELLRLDARLFAPLLLGDGVGL
jgi:hypothetical protein